MNSDSRASAPGDGNPLVHITGYVDEKKQRYLSAERFGDVVSSIDCQNDQITFTFSSQDGYASAKEKWGWVNTGDRSVIITLESGTCGNEKRQPYLAQNVDYNDGSRRTNFKAAKSNWADSAPGYKVVADTRGFVDQPSDAAALTRRLSSDASVDLTHDFSGNIFTSPDVLNTSLEFNMDCEACSTSGRLDFRFDAESNIIGGIFGGENFSRPPPRSSPPASVPTWSWASGSGAS